MIFYNAQKSSVKFRRITRKKKSVYKAKPRFSIIVGFLSYAQKSDYILFNTVFYAKLDLMIGLQSDFSAKPIIISGQIMNCVLFFYSLCTSWRFSRLRMCSAPVAMR